MVWIASAVAPPDRALTLLRDMTVKVNSLDALEGPFVGLDILRKYHATSGLSLAAIEAADKAADARAAELKEGADAPISRLLKRIELAFLHREKPTVLVVPCEPADLDDEDALWFAGRDWRDITSGLEHAFERVFQVHARGFQVLSPEHPVHRRAQLRRATDGGRCATDEARSQSQCRLVG